MMQRTKQASCRGKTIIYFDSIIDEMNDED